MELTPVVEQFGEIARREHKSTSELLMELVSDHVKKHGKGNPTFSLEKWQDEPEFVALPTIGEPLTLIKLSKLADSDFELLEKQVTARFQEVASPAGGGMTCGDVPHKL